jgi:hypothetical protein
MLRRACLFLLAAFLVSLLAACGSGGETPAVSPLRPGTPVPVSVEAAQHLQARIDAIAVSPQRDFRLEITDEEATSYLAQLPNSPLVDAQVWFTGERVYLAGTVIQPMRLQLATRWSTRLEDGKARLVLEHASVGCFTLPNGMLSALSATINEMIDESQTGIVITDVQIEEGRAIITGTKSQATG